VTMGPSIPGDADAQSRQASRLDSHSLSLKDSCCRAGRGDRHAVRAASAGPAVVDFDRAHAAPPGPSSSRSSAQHAPPAPRGAMHLPSHHTDVTCSLDRSSGPLGRALPATPAHLNHRRATQITRQRRRDPSLRLRAKGSRSDGARRRVARGSAPGQVARSGGKMRWQRTGRSMRGSGRTEARSGVSHCGEGRSPS
jgi:hypothetical protein